MAYRRIDISADRLDIDEVRESLIDCSILEHIERHENEEGGRQTILVVDEHAEPVIDALRERFDGREGLRITVQEITAIWPRPEAGEESDEANAARQRHRGRVSRDELLEELERGSRTRPVYLVQAGISSLVAAIGMTRDSVTLVIAAMVIAPLLLPNMALALGVVVGDLSMARRSCMTLALGLLVGFVVAIATGMVIPVDVTAFELTSRTHVRLSDLVVAVAAGVAGAIAVTTGVSANLIGVMVAVALVPPLTAIGLLASIGEWHGAAGASVLLGANVVCVLLAAVVVYLVQGIRARTWYETQKARKAVWIASSLGAVLLAGLAALIVLAGQHFALDQ